MKAVIVGAGIGGLAAAAALHQRGVQVTVVERAGELRAGGAALSLWPNALRGLDRLGIGEHVRGQARLGGDSGIRRPDGRWLARSQLGPAIVTRFGDPLVLLHRATLAALLIDRMPPGAVRYGMTVTGVHPGQGKTAAVLQTSGGDLPADLVVAADGIRSTLRPSLFPAALDPRYAGYTAWRLVVPDPGGTEPAETWGPDGSCVAASPAGMHRSARCWPR